MAMPHDYDPLTHICRRCFRTKVQVYALGSQMTLGCGKPPADVGSIVNQLVLTQEGRSAGSTSPEPAEADPCSVVFSPPSSA